MFALTRRLTAVTTLADNLAALSATVAEVNGGLRCRLALEAPEEGQALDHGPAGRDVRSRSFPATAIGATTECFRSPCKTHTAGRRA